MTILAVYYTVADIVLLCQCFYYRGFTLSDEPPHRQHEVDGTDSRQMQHSGGAPASESSPLLPDSRTSHRRRPSLSSLRDQISSLDGTHLSPATPFIGSDTTPNTQPRKLRSSTTRAVLFNTFSILVVCAMGTLGWYVSVRSARQPIDHGDSHYNEPPKNEHRNDAGDFDVLGQVFGYLCAVLYLGSRLPQLLLNWRRKSTEGVSMLFFLFACIGNLTYVLSIFAYLPSCKGTNGACLPGEQEAIYARHLLINLSWLLGSLGTLFLDMGIFTQFILYRKKSESDTYTSEDVR